MSTSSKNPKSTANYYVSVCQAVMIFWFFWRFQIFSRNQKRVLKRIKVLCRDQTPKIYSRVLPPNEHIRIWISELTCSSVIQDFLYYSKLHRKIFLQNYGFFKKSKTHFCPIRAVISTTKTKLSSIGCEFPENIKICVWGSSESCAIDDVFLNNFSKNKIWEKTRIYISLVI